MKKLLLLNYILAFSLLLFVTACQKEAATNTSDTASENLTVPSEDVVFSQEEIAKFEAPQGKGELSTRSRSYNTSSRSSWHRTSYKPSDYDNYGRHYSAYIQEKGEYDHSKWGHVTCYREYKYDYRKKQSSNYKVTYRDRNGHSIYADGYSRYGKGCDGKYYHVFYETIRGGTGRYKDYSGDGYTYWSSNSRDNRYYRYNDWYDRCDRNYDYSYDKRNYRSDNRCSGHKYDRNSGYNKHDKYCYYDNCDDWDSYDMYWSVSY